MRSIAYLSTNICIASLLLVATGCGKQIEPTTPTTEPQAAPIIDVLEAANFGPQEVLEFETDALPSISPLRTLSLSGLNIATDGSGNIYILSLTSLSEYSLAASGTVSPIRTITLASQAVTGGFAVDSAGNAYLTCSGGGIAVYGPSATGNAQPTRVIAGTLTQLGFINGLAVDGLGNLFVLSYYPNIGPSPILVFAPGATGNVAPERTIDIYPESIAVDTAGNLYTADEAPGSQGNASGNEILVYASGANGNAVPMRTITGATTQLASSALWSTIVVDSQSDVYVGGGTTNSFGLLEFASDASGNAAPTASLTIPNMVAFIVCRPLASYRPSMRRHVSLSGPIALRVCSESGFSATTRNPLVVVQRWKPMSQKRDMGHPSLWRWPDLGHPRDGITLRPAQSRQTSQADGLPQARGGILSGSTARGYRSSALRYATLPSVNVVIVPSDQRHTAATSGRSIWQFPRR